MIDLEELLSKNIQYTVDGRLKSGVVHEVAIKQSGTFAYILAFGEQFWADVNDLGKTWFIKD